jgi:hypothetical protein
VKRSAPLRRTAFRRIRQREEGPATQREPHPSALLPTAKPLHRGVYAGSTSGVPVPKENALQHAGYMAAVRNLGYCMLCRRACRPQFCHADMGKGERIKTDVRRGWPGCGPGKWGPGCHWLVGMSGQYPKEERRALEADLARRTRAAVIAAGLWPARLPRWGDVTR